MDWQAIGGNIATGLLALLVIIRLVRRDKQDQALVNKMNGIASDFANCVYKTEATASKEEAAVDASRNI